MFSFKIQIKSYKIVNLKCKKISFPMSIKLVIKFNIFFYIKTKIFIFLSVLLKKYSLAFEWHYKSSVAGKNNEMFCYAQHNKLS